MTFADRLSGDINRYFMPHYGKSMIYNVFGGSSHQIEAIFNDAPSNDQISDLEAEQFDKIATFSFNPVINETVTLFPKNQDTIAYNGITYTVYRDQNKEEMITVFTFSGRRPQRPI